MNGSNLEKEKQLGELFGICPVNNTAQFECNWLFYLQGKAQVARIFFPLSFFL